MRLSRVALGAITAAAVVAVNNFSGPLSIAIPPLYFNIRLSAPLIFLVTLIDPVAGILGAALGTFTYDLLMGRYFSAVFIGLLGSPIFYIIFYRVVI